ncbi:hypothetical protein [Synechococcus sp. CCY 9618]|uniref:hypothetical protein n=1 Tax=Synechococcus sp. CCY 9618 TaxID=2815602 RepID=UPI001C22C92B|nr:hypothetical protein [Synechococcus sp. CCY 9618]
MPVDGVELKVHVLGGLPLPLTFEVRQDHPVLDEGIHHGIHPLHRGDEQGKLIADFHRDDAWIKTDLTFISWTGINRIPSSAPEQHSIGSCYGILPTPARRWPGSAARFSSAKFQ